MNARQAAKAAAKRIEELEDFNRRASADIKEYNSCILDMIEGGSPCKYCEDYSECQLEEKDRKGCKEWWLRYKEAEKEDSDDSKGIHGASPEGGSRT